jgi:hypothetical protein
MIHLFEVFGKNAASIVDLSVVEMKLFWEDLVGEVTVEYPTVERLLELVDPSRHYRRDSEIRERELLQEKKQEQEPSE